MMLTRDITSNENTSEDSGAQIVDLCLSDKACWDFQAPALLAVPTYVWKVYPRLNDHHQRRSICKNCPRYHEIFFLTVSHVLPSQLTPIQTQTAASHIFQRFLKIFNAVRNGTKIKIRETLRQGIGRAWVAWKEGCRLSLISFRCLSGEKGALQGGLASLKFEISWSNLSLKTSLYMTFCRKPLVFSSFSEVQRQPGQALGILSLVDLMAEPAVERINRNLIAFERLAWTYFALLNADIFLAISSCVTFQSWIIAKFKIETTVLSYEWR